ncbi:hypothetical protein [Psychrobacillus sp. FJAT-21963]|uniref:hypothetical protein n=1 Tax=Psychrobacillus sp. FJAT-21963 TaxID=1712028 RepID=UPI0006FBB69E|nr:hypothetical protein [Psychrobacillus sp. FJAT-21963]KQL36048.1 hypothetical protein AN959_09225 [Psychrobacillus sp. FJAT-21963]
MPLEEGVFELLIGGFSVVMGIAILTLLLLWLQKKNNSSAYVWTLLHLILFSVAVYFFLKAISFDYEHVMASEENSFQIGVAGIIWTFSMFCLIIGIFKFSNSGKVITS